MVEIKLGLFVWEKLVEMWSRDLVEGMFLVKCGDEFKGSPPSFKAIILQSCWAKLPAAR